MNSVRLSPLTETARQHAVSDNAELRQVIDCLPEAIVLLDAQNRLLLWNRNYEKMFPDTADYFKPGISIESIYRMPSKRPPRHQRWMRAAEEAWLKNRLDRLNQDDSIVEQNLGDWPLDPL